MAIILEELKFDNMYSYAKGNELILNENSITQLTAPNGSGKTSLALIIQELLYSKNIKGIKKPEIKNRYINTTDWYGSINFKDSISQKQYKIEVFRKNATSKVYLYEDGKDISEHKIPDTYKKIKSIIKLDFDIFSQLTYQSSVDLLQFLKATDTNRKKFLINLFNLEKYLSYGEIIKVKLNEIEKEIISLNGELNSVERFLSETKIPEKIEFKQEITINNDWYTEQENLKFKKHTFSELCKKIDKNNLYQKERKNLVFELNMEYLENFTKEEEYNSTLEQLMSISVELRNDTIALKTLNTSDTCPECGQSIDNSQALEMEEKIRNRLKLNEAKKKSYDIILTTLNEEKERIEKYRKKFDENKKRIEKFEQISQMIDTSVPSDYPNIQEIEFELNKITEKINSIEQENKKISLHNNKVREHNTRINTLTDQKREFLVRKELVKQELEKLKIRSSNLTVLKRAFSPIGLVAFKLENLTKNLEETINYYLSELSDGTFQVIFRLSGEKLNIVIVQDGIESPIENVSGGEFGRIQTAILLAIRSVLSDIGGNSVNLLFLDEISGTLDDAGKEKLIEVLQNEKDLNVFLISHDFSHPLIEKIPIIKENNISRIEH